MTVDQLPATARIDEGLIMFVLLVLLLGAALASIAYAAAVERRKARHLHLTAAQVDRSARIAAGRHAPDPLPWPLEHHDREEVAPWAG